MHTVKYWDKKLLALQRLADSVGYDNAMSEKQIKEFYDACPSSYGVEETRVFDMLSLQYATVYMRYIKLF